MPSRMEEIAARSAKSGEEYRANKAANDAAAEAWKRKKKSEDSKRSVAVKRVSVAAAPKEFGVGVDFSRDYHVSPAVEPPGQGVLAVVPPPVVADEPPADLVDYSLSPVAMEPPWEMMPAGGALYAIAPVMGTMLIYLGKRLIISMALAGAAEVGKFAMQRLGTYTMNARDASIRYHTGRSPGFRQGMPVTPAERSRGVNPTGTGYVEDDPGLLQSVWDGMQFSWGIVKEQWRDPSTFFWWTK